jgi:hypothetical protein
MESNLLSNDVNFSGDLEAYSTEKLIEGLEARTQAAKRQHAALISSRDTSPIRESSSKKMKIEEPSQLAEVSTFPTELTLTSLEKWALCLLPCGPVSPVSVSNFCSMGSAFVTMVQKAPEEVVLFLEPPLHTVVEAVKSDTAIVLEIRATFPKERYNAYLEEIDLLGAPGGHFVKLWETRISIPPPPGWTKGLKIRVKPLIIKGGGNTYTVHIPLKW